MRETFNCFNSFLRSEGEPTISTRAYPRLSFRLETCNFLTTRAWRNGRRARLRIWFRKDWRFKSSRAHQLYSRKGEFERDKRSDPHTRPGFAIFGFGISAPKIARIETKFNGNSSTICSRLNTDTAANPSR